MRDRRGIGGAAVDEILCSVEGNNLRLPSC